MQHLSISPPSPSVMLADSAPVGQGVGWVAITEFAIPVFAILVPTIIAIRLARWERKSAEKDRRDEREQRRHEELADIEAARIERSQRRLQEMMSTIIDLTIEFTETRTDEEGWNLIFRIDSWMSRLHSSLHPTDPQDLRTIQTIMDSIDFENPPSLIDVEDELRDSTRGDHNEEILRTWLRLTAKCYYLLNKYVWNDKQTINEDRSDAQKWPSPIRYVGHVHAVLLQAWELKYTALRLSDPLSEVAAWGEALINEFEPEESETKSS